MDSHYSKVNHQGSANPEKEDKNSRLVLIVDDEAGLVALVSSILANAGYSVISANSANAALQVIKDRNPDIVISDIRMPGDDGFVLLQKSMLISPDLCVILMTGHGDKELAIKAVRENAFDYLSKPFQEDELLIAVDRANQQITLRKKIEQDRSNFQFALVQAAKLSSLGTMAAGIAHELNNPLAGIYAYLWQLLENPKLEEEDRATLQKTYNLAARMAKVVSQILIFAREGQESRITQVNILEVLSESFSIFEQKIKSNNVKIFFDIAAKIPLISGDKSKLVSVFHNLINNACDAFTGKDMADKPRNISVKITHHESLIEIKFVDNAAGISEENMSKIYDPFFSTKKVGEGTGLGLTISHKIVEDHQGKIICKSSVGLGTTFTILLPGIAGTVADEVSLSQNNDDFVMNNVPKILIIDKEDLVCDIFELMAKGKFKVTISTNTRNGFERIEREEFDLIVADVDMTHLDGVSIFEQVKNKSQKSQVVVMSGGLILDNKVDTLGTPGAVKFINKPVLNKDEILNLFRETLEKKRLTK